jgi:hypothetical protein
MIYAFKIVNDKIELNVTEILKFPILAQIYKRDKTTEKQTAYKEFMYICFCADKEGICAKKGYNKKETHLFAVSNSQLANDYIPDGYVKDAISFCEDNLNTNVVEDLIRSTLRGLRLSGKTIEILLEKVDERINKNDVTPEALGIYDKSVKELIKIAADIPNRIDNLMTLLNNYDKFSTGTNKLRGGQEYRSSYDGYDDKELNGSFETERIS